MSDNSNSDSQNSSQPSAYQKALDWLARREHSTAELRIKLRQKGYLTEDIAATLTQLVEHGYLNDDRYAAMLVRSRQSRYGSHRITAELAAKGIAPEKVAEALASNEQDEFVTALSVWHKRYRELPTDQREKARQLTYLQRRGFSLGIILRILNGEGVTKNDFSGFYDTDETR